MTYTSYPRDMNDWRGRFMFDLAVSLSQQPGLDLSLWGPPGSVPGTARYIANESESVWLNELQERGGIAHLLRRHRLQGLKSALGLLRLLRSAYRRKQVDVFHVNWLPNALPLPNNGLPALITVLGTDYQLLKLPGMVSWLRGVLKQRKSIISPNADWMQPRLQHLFGDVSQICVNPFGVQSEWLELERRIDTHRRKWLVVLRITKKKIGALFEWGEKLFQQDDELHVFGPMQEALTLPDWVHYHGSTHPQELREQWFPQASGLITLSQHDEGRPQIILDAMAAGLPVIASNIPAHENMIQTGITGLLVKNETEFANSLERLSDTETNLTFGQHARNWIKHNIGDWSDCARRYYDFYKRLVV